MKGAGICSLYRGFHCIEVHYIKARVYVVSKTKFGIIQIMVKNDSNFYKDNPDWENSYMEIHFLNFTSRARNRLQRNSVKLIFKFCFHNFFF